MARRALIVAVLGGWLGAFAALAADLPSPAELVARWALPSETVTVIEPHLSDVRQDFRVSYRAVRLAPILDKLFAAKWRAADAEIVFFARDGYRSAVSAELPQAKSAWLAFARTDGQPFVVDNPRQRESSVYLGPYYLIWDNLADRAVRIGDEYGWPYQVERIELGSRADVRRLLPERASADAVQGLMLTQRHCLTCHAIDGVGGRKVIRDLRDSACALGRDELEAWMLRPDDRTPGTAMPPLNTLLADPERRRVAGLIALYLRGIDPRRERCQAVR